LFPFHGKGNHTIKKGKTLKAKGEIKKAEVRIQDSGKAKQRQLTMKDIKILKIKGRVQNPEIRIQNSG